MTPDIYIDQVSPGFYHFGSRTPTGQEWLESNVSYDVPYSDGTRYMVDMAEGATGDGLAVAVDGYLFQPGGTRGPRLEA